ncbi:MAG: hypothetical protein OEM24_06115 [Paracoccaceae bacterium]|nr:hypothetical protein [Paracoccaceae bacterium]
MAVGPSKLTVSYGTFSCTLEGFDDAFSTMKAVAEYFRDLSAQDRHFGALPPEPDAQMLEQLAEQEIRRRVDARIGDDGMVLRAGGEPLRTSAFEAPPAPAAPGESVAARLARLRATAARVRTAEETPTKSIFAEDEAAETRAHQALPNGMDAERSKAAEPEAEREAAAALPEGPEEPPSRPMDWPSGEPQEASVEERASEQEAAETGMAPGETGAGWTPPRAADEAETGEQDGGAEPGPAEEPEEAVAEEPAPAPAAAEAGRAREETGAGWAPPLADGEAETEAQHGDAEPGPAAEAREAAVDERAPAQAAAETGPAPEETGAGWTPPQAAAEAEAPSAEGETRAEEAREAAGPAREPERFEPGAAAPAMAASAPAAQDEDELGEDTDEAIGRFLFEDEPDDRGTPAEAEEPLGPMLLTRPVVEPPPRGQVENQLRTFMNRLRTASMAVTEPQPGVPEYVPAPGSEPQAPGAAATTPPAPAIAEPAAARAPGAEQDETPEARRPVEARARREDSDDEALNRDLDRLMATADSQLEVADNRRRIDALSHMKAAVAATEADRQLSSDDETGQEAEDEFDRYREDLSRLVQAQLQPAPESARRREEAATARTVPLVLASEQRVDQALGQGLAAAAGAPPPGRVAGATSAYLPGEHDDEDGEDGEDGEEAGAEAKRTPSMPFAAFAANLGASGLGEVMEAAAAYLAVHEGREFFSRPQIMRKVALVVSEDDYSREDGLRAFGALLREGRIAKLRRGQFTISKTSRYTDKARGLTH